MDVSLLIAIPHCRDFKSWSAACLVGLTHRLASQGIEGHNLVGLELASLSNVSLLPKGRQMAFTKAINGNHTHAILLDDDMTYPQNILDVFFSRNVPIVAANYPKKKPGEIEWTASDLAGETLSSTGKKGCEEAGYVGLGAALISVDAIKKVAPPHFEVRWNKELQDYVGEDHFFCAKMRQAGIPVYVDHDVSQAMGHIGDFIYKGGSFNILDYEKPKPQPQQSKETENV